MRFPSVPIAIGEVTAAWLAAVVGDVEALTVEEIGGDFGLSGTTYRLDLQTSCGHRRLVAKLAGARQTERELTFYEKCAPRTPVPLPSLVGGAVDHGEDRGVVVLDHLPGVRQGDVLVGCTRDEALTLAELLGAMHAAWWGGEDPALAPLVALASPRQAIRSERLAPFVERHGASLPDDVRGRVEVLPELVPAAHGALAAGPATLTHRDFHADNVLFPAAGPPYVIDWQSAAVGPPAVDVARLLVECLTAEQQRAFGDAAVERYLARLAEAGIDRQTALRREIEQAAVLAMAGVVNWLGATPRPDPPGSRREALGRNLLTNLVVLLTE